jgi:hypothetical protein
MYVEYIPGGDGDEFKKVQPKRLASSIDVTVKRTAAENKLWLGGLLR